MANRQVKDVFGDSRKDGQYNQNGFFGVDTFLDALLDQVATTDEEIDTAIDRDEKLDLARAAITTLRTWQRWS
jgi:hypothetical protein